MSLTVQKFRSHQLLLLIGIVLCLETVVSGHKSHYETYKNQHEPHHTIHHLPHRGHHKMHHAHKYQHHHLAHPLPDEEHHYPHKHHHHQHHNKKHYHKPQKVYYEEPEMSPTPYCPEPFGNFPIPNSDCTGFYYMCKSYIHIVKKCPGKQVFDAKSKMCHYGSCLDLSNKH